MMRAYVSEASLEWRIRGRGRAVGAYLKSNTTIIIVMRHHPTNHNP
jgi:hypothetical protein